MLKPKSKLILSLTLLYFILLGCFTVRYYYRDNHYLKIVFLNIGQGDATLITTATKKHILIDCGPDQAILNALDQELSWWDRTIDIVIISHDHADHWGGLSDLVKKYKIEQVILAKPSQISSEFASVLNNISTQNIKITNLYAPAIVNLDDGSKLSIIWPTEANIAEQDNINNQSLVIKWQYGQKFFLWTGDLESDAEDELMANYTVNEPINILKIAHHGSWTATSPRWLNYWQPDLAVISVGANNSLGLPNEIILDRLKRQGVQIWRTDINGKLVIYTDGQTLWRANK